MELEEALYYFLSTEPSIKEILEDRIYPMVMPQKCKLPALIYSPVSTERSHVLLEDTGFVKKVMEVSCYGRSYREVVDVSKTVRKVLQNFSGPMGELYIQGTLLISEIGADDGLQKDEYRLICEYEFQFIES